MQDGVVGVAVPALASRKAYAGKRVDVCQKPGGGVCATSHSRVAPLPQMQLDEPGERIERGATRRSPLSNGEHLPGSQRHAGSSTTCGRPARTGRHGRLVSKRSSKQIDGFARRRRQSQLCRT